MQQSAISIFAGTVVAAGSLAARRLVTAAGAYPAAGAAHYGCTKTSGNAGELVTVDVIGTAVVEAGGTVTQFGPVSTDSSGRVVDHDGVDVVSGRAMTGTDAAGQFVEVLLFQVA